MYDQNRNTEGFTLAELLLAVAIVVVLIALAAPSIANIQRNMRMVQLDAAASDIAEAAQHQMTSLKVSGTWAAFFDDELSADSGHATGVSEEVSADHPADDLYYMTAEQARTLGILPAGSIDEEVRDGDFVIEYRASTATVFGVFYTDGKTGFFQSASSSIQEDRPAETYYLASAHPAKRDHDARINADPMIGYFGGEPAGATNAVALANPAIWVNEEDGRLYIQDPNLSKHPEWLTSLEVFIENQESGSSATIAFAGLQGEKNATTYQVGPVLDSDRLITCANNGATKLYTVGLRDAFDVKADTYAFDLEMLKTSGDDTLKALAEGFSHGDKVKITASVKTGQRPYTPASSTAYIEWPDPVSIVRIMVTDPANADGTAGGVHISGSYIAPKTQRIAVSGEPIVTGTELKPYSEVHRIESTNEALIRENSESAYQRYLGAYIGIDDAVADQIRLEATVGAYTSISGTTHWYQVHELWVGIGSDSSSSAKERIGYMTDNRWQWVGSGSWLSSAISGITQGSDTAGTLSLTVDPEALSAAMRDQGLDGEVLTLYVRTAPSIDEVRTYFTGQSDPYGHESASLGQIPLISRELSGNMTTGSRGIEAGSLKPFRKNFENEFGCPSSDASWALSKKPLSGQSGKGTSSFPGNTNDIRIYYAVTPAFGFNTTLNASGNVANNTALWYYSARENTVYPQAMAYPSRGGAPYYMTSTNSSGQTNADFEFRTDRDYLFYRVLKFYGQIGLDETIVALDMDVQYVPFSFQYDVRVATIPAADAIYDSSGTVAKVFSGWVTNDTNPKGGTLNVQAGKLVGNYHDQLDYSGTKLTARYADVGIGMAYLEFGTDAASGQETMGYSGYLTPGQSKVESLLDNDSAIQSWGYYVLVPEGSFSGNKLQATDGNVSISGGFRSVTIQGIAYQAYQVTARRGVDKTGNLTARYFIAGDADRKYEYTINTNFACAVGTSEEEAERWGKNESTPWEVRHASQFIGALPLNDGVQVSYVGNCFRQTHTIDMADARTIKLDNVFSGVYDGGSTDGCVIENVQKCLSSYYVVNGGSTTEWRGSGMFPKVVGSEEKRAQVKNVAIVMAGSDFGGVVGGAYEWDTLSPYSHLGVLVGFMSYGDLENCTVSGNKDDVPTINLTIGTDSARGWGVLFGGVEHSTVKNCSVRSLSLVANRKNGGIWNSNLSIGALGGQAIDATIDQCTVDRVTVGTVSATNTVLGESRGVVSIGGLVGNLSGEASSCSKATVSNVGLVVSADQYDAIGKRGLIFGAIAGASTVSLDASGAFSNVVLKAGNVLLDVVEAFGVRPKEALDQPLDAARAFPDAAAKAESSEDSMGDNAVLPGGSGPAPADPLQPDADAEGDPAVRKEVR